MFDFYLEILFLKRFQFFGCISPPTPTLRVGVFFKKLFGSCKTVGFQLTKGLSKNDKVIPYHPLKNCLEVGISQLTKGLLKNTHPQGGGVFQKIEIFILKYFVANNLNQPPLTKLITKHKPN